MNPLATIKANLLASALGLLATILLVITIVQTVEIHGFGVWPLKIPGLKAKYETSLNKLNEARAELKRISTTKDEQRETTKGNIQKVERNERESAPIVKIIREAPIPPNCRTPGLDVLRNEI